MGAVNKSMDVPLVTLSIEARTALSTLLNPLKVIPTATNLPRDWRGIAELSSVPGETIALLESKPDPFKELLVHLSWSGGNKNNFNVCIDDLKAFLAVIDRFDVLEDVEPILERDKEAFLSKVSEVHLDRQVETLNAKEDSNTLTFEDAVRAQKGLPLCRYDSFILYSDEDASFASEMIHRLQDDYGLKICSKEDLMPGHKFEHEIIGKMIENRCNRLLVIFSPSFLQSSANQFLVSYAQAVALDTRSRKIIPCVYKRCDLPPSVRFSFCIDYNRSGKLWNFWEKLSQSIIIARQTNTQTEDQQTIKQSSGSYIAKSSLGPESLEWWDATKPNHSNSPAVCNNGVSESSSSPNSLEDRMETMSIHSQANLLPGKSTENKPSKWLNKLMKPMSRKKHAEKDKFKKGSPLAE